MSEDDADGAESEGAHDGTTAEGTADDGGTAPLPSLDGMAIDEAVAAVVDADPDRDPEAVRRALSQVTEDGVVTADAVDDALGDLSQVVATPETRLELAEGALEAARETADPVSELGVVQARLAEYEAELAALRERLDALQDALGEAVDREADDSLYAVGRDCAELTGEANALQRAADDLKFELEEDFEAWLTDPETRATRLGEDADAVEAMLDELNEVAKALDDAGGETPTLPGGDEIEDPRGAWFDATLRVRVAQLLLEDLRAECADLRAWADRGPEDRPDEPLADADDGSESGATTRERLDDVEARLGSLDERAAGLDDWLAALAESSWRRRLGDRVTTFEHALADRRPPIDWGAVQATLEEHRAAALEATGDGT